MKKRIDYQIGLFLFIALFGFPLVAFSATDTTAATPVLAEAEQNLSLDKCIQFALYNNLDMRSAREQLKISESSYRISKSKTDVKGTVSGAESGSDSGDSRTDSADVSISKYFLTGGTASLSSDAAHSPDGDSAYSSSETIKISQPLLKGYGGTNTYYTAAGRKIYNEQIAISRMLQSNKRSLIYSVTASYYGLIGAQRSIQIAESAVDESQRLLKAAQTKKEEGLVAKIDVIRAEVQLAQTQARLVSSKRNYESQLDSFVNLLGLELGTPLTIDTTINYVVRTVNLDSSLSLAFRNRTDYRSAELELALDAISLKIAKRNLLPEVSADASYSFSDSGSDFGDAFHLSNSSWAASLSWSVPLWQNRFSLKESYMQEVAQQKLAQIAFEDKKRSITLEVRQAIIGVLEAQENLQILEKSVAAAEESLRLAKLSYEEALVSYLDVLNAQNNYTEVQNSYTNALIGYLKALANLDRVTASDPHLS
ncbi:MAG: TolC family protein [bacterium]|nr:TolC family protein [bacterium]